MPGSVRARWLRWGRARRNREGAIEDNRNGPHEAALPLLSLTPLSLIGGSVDWNMQKAPMAVAVEAELGADTFAKNDVVHSACSRAWQRTMRACASWRLVARTWRCCGCPARGATQHRYPELSIVDTGNRQPRAWRHSSRPTWAHQGGPFAVLLRSFLWPSPVPRGEHCLRTIAAGRLPADIRRRACPHVRSHGAR
jgi:hypothetical protein